MILIDNILVEEGLTKANFSCDLGKCKGACCTIPGDSGAPVLESELENMKLAFNSAKKYLSERSLLEIEKNGIVEFKDGEYTTVCIDNKDCVFVYYEGDVAKCSIEKAYFNGETNFRKPISCHLFPIRVGNFGGSSLYYEQFDVCKPGRELGLKSKIPLVESVKESLIRAFGTEWYDKLLTNLKNR